MLFFVTRRCFQQSQPRPWFSAATYDASAPKVGFFQARWQRFRAYTVGRKLSSLTVLGLKGIGAFVLLCCAVHLVQGPFIFRAFSPRVDQDFLLEQWAEIEPTLKEGDIVLMRGRGLMSWAITTAQYGLSRLMHASAFRYSHVAVVVAPVQYADANDTTPSADHGARRWWHRRGPTSQSASVAETLRSEDTAASTQRTITRGALLLEAMDNGEYHVPDVDGVVRYDQVQVVEASKRICSQSPSGEPAYYYFAVRRLQPCSLAQVADPASLVAKGPITLPANDLHGRPLEPAVESSASSPHAGLPSAVASAVSSPYVVLSPSELAACCGHATEPRAVLQAFIADNLGRPMDPSPLYVLSFMSPAVYQWLRPARAKSGEVSCSELIVELYQRMGLIQRHWRWEPLTPHESAQAALAPSHAKLPAVAEPIDANTATRVLLWQSAQSAAHNLAAEGAWSLRQGGGHIWENVYSRANLRVARQQEWRLPLVKSGETMEGPPELLASGGEVLLCAPREGVAHTVALDVVLSDDTSGELRDTRAADDRRRTASSSSFSSSSPPPPQRAQVLHAGLVRTDASGKLYQLRWHYRHSSLQTSPYQFTEAGDKRVLDWRTPFKLGAEEFMEMPAHRFAFEDMRTKA